MSRHVPYIVSAVHHRYNPLQGMAASIFCLAGKGEETILFPSKKRIAGAARTRLKVCVFKEKIFSLLFFSIQVTLFHYRNATGAGGRRKRKDTDRRTKGGYRKWMGVLGSVQTACRLSSSFLDIFEATYYEFAMKS